MSYIYNGSNELLGELLGDAEIEQLFSVNADIAAMLGFEMALANAQAAFGVITPAAAGDISDRIAEVQIDLPELATRIARDGVAPPGLVAQLRAVLDPAHASSLHKGATSQDLVDTSLMIRLAQAVPVLSARVAQIERQLQTFASDSAEMMAHTRMQRALPITRTRKIESWSKPLRDLVQGTPEEFALQLGGPEGALNAMGDDPEKIAEHMAQSLGLYAPPSCWHTDRRRVVAICGWAVEITTALGKVGQDIALMAQNELAQVQLAAGGSSSAMAHKNNPIGAETLVAIARSNAVLMGGMHQAALHENERSGAGWTLEWMLLPQIFVNAGASTRTAAALAGSISFT